MASGENGRRVWARAVSAHQPLSVAIELTHRCNFECRHCYIPEHAVSDGLATPRLVALLDELADTGTLFLTLTGGEPLLRPDWAEIARHARKRAFALRFLTNGSLVDEGVADELAALQATVEVSVYSMDAEVFAHITRRRGSLAEVLRGVGLLRERGVPVVLKVPVLAPNAAGVATVFAHAASIGAECRAYPQVVHDKSGGTGPLALRTSADELLAFHRARLPGRKVIPVSPRPPAAGPLCAAAASYCNITSAGDVLACNVFPASAGNVNERPFGEIWRDSPVLAEVRALRRSDLTPCDTCPRLPYCGRCHACALAEDGDLRGPWRWACRQAEILERVAAEDA